MKGRYRAGWYQRSDDDAHHVTRIVRIGNAWISTLWSRDGGRPCAAGIVLTKAHWSLLTPAEPIPSVDDELLASAG